MSDHRPDLLSTPPPDIDPAGALDLVRTQWLPQAGRASVVACERDAIFSIDDAYILKISHEAETASSVDMEIQAQNLLAAASPPIPVPVQIPTVGGDRTTLARAETPDGKVHLARLATVLPGRELEGRPISCETAFDMGALGARVQRALQGFFHPDGNRVRDWDIRRLPAIAPATGALRDIATRVAPALAATRGMSSSIQHADLTLTNVLADGETVCGVIDFGDMHHTADVCDFAVTLASVLRNTAPRQDTSLWDLAAATIDGYQSVRLMSLDEATILGELVLARLAATEVISRRRTDAFAGNADYIARYDDANARTLTELAALPAPELSRRILRIAGLAYAPRRFDLHPERAVPASPEAADAALLDRRRAVMGGALSPLFYRSPLHIVGGRGPWMYTADGRTLLDAYNNVAVIGHSHPAVTQAVSKQLEVLNTHSRYLHDGIVTLAERILATMPPELDTCLFTTSGTEANELAWRFATAHTGRSAAVVAEHAYHGSTRWMADLSSNEWPPGYRPGHVETFAAPRNLTEETGRAAAKERIAAAAARAAAAGDGAALVVADSMFTSEGILDAPASFFQGLADAAHQAGALYLADEVQAGYGRTGPQLWRFALAGVVPDLVSLGKPMGNGFPLAALVTRADIAAALAADYEYFSTFAATPVAAAAGLAVLDTLTDRAIPQRSVTVGDYLAGALVDLARSHPALGEVRHRGLMIGIDLVAGGEPAPRPWAQDLRENLVRHGVLAGLTGPTGTVLKVRPPLVWTERHADLFLQALTGALRDTPAPQAGGTA